MTVAIPDTRRRYPGTGSVGPFPYPYKVFDQDDLLVILTDTDKVDHTQVIATHYTVDGVGDDGGGNVTMITAPAVGEYLSIIRNMPLLQESVFTDNDPFPADTMEDALDKLTMEVQQLQEVASRSPQITTGSGLRNLKLPTPAANTPIGWDAAGTALKNFSPAGTYEIPQIDYIGNYTSLANAVATIGGANVMLLINASTPVTADLTVPSNLSLWVSQEGRLPIDSGKTLTIGGAFEAGLHTVFDGAGTVVFGPGAVKEVYPQWWGAVADWDGATGTDNYAAFTAALAAHNRVFAPGKYKVSQPVVVNDDNDLEGDGDTLIINPSTSAPGGWPGAAWYWTNAVQVGNYGGWGNGYGVDEETPYDIATITPPVNTVTFITAADSDDFAVGDIVFLTSYATKAVTAEIKYSQTNKVLAIATGVLTLELPILDSYISTPPNYSHIRRVSGTVTGLDGLPAGVVQNVRLANLTIQSTKLASTTTWSAMHASPYNIKMENVDILGSYAGLGLNPGARILLNNVHCQVDSDSGTGYPLEVVYLTNNVVLRNVQITAVGTITCALNLGEHGCDVEVDGLTINGDYSLYGVLNGKHRTSYRNLRVVNTNAGGIGWQTNLDLEDVALRDSRIVSGSAGIGVVVARYNQRLIITGNTIDRGAYGISLAAALVTHISDVQIRNNKLLNWTTNGILSGDTLDRVKILDNTIVRASGTEWAVEFGATAHTDCEASGNIIGVTGSRILQDSIHDQNAPGVIKAENNIGFTSQSITRDYTVGTLTGTLDLTTIKSKSFTGETFRGKQGFDFQIAGTVAGVNNAKVINLMFATATIDTFTYLAAETGNYRIIGRLWNTGGGVIRADYEIQFYNGTTSTFKKIGYYSDTLNITPNFTFNIDGDLANVGDTITVDSFIVEPINDSLVYG